MSGEGGIIDLRTRLAAAEGSITTVSITAAESLGGHRAITAAGLHATESTLAQIIGITTGAVNLGDMVTYIAAGAMEESGWNWTPNAPVFAGETGILTQVEPLGTLRCIGVAVTATRLAVDLQPTIYRM